MQDRPPWLMMFAGDIVLTDENHEPLGVADRIHGSGIIQIGPEPAVKSENFAYLGSITGVVCDFRIPSCYVCLWSKTPGMPKEAMSRCCNASEFSLFAKFHNDRSMENIL